MPSGLVRARRALLHVPTFPDAVPERVLESACTLAQLLGTQLTAQMPQLNSDRASWPAVMGAFPTDFLALMQDLVNKSEANAEATAQDLTRTAADFGVQLDLRRALTTLHAPPDILVDLARLHDIVMMPVPESSGFGRPPMQAVLFGGGRPVVLLPARRLRQLDRIVVAWDYSREAARALADALPLMARAREIRLITVAGEKHVKTTARRADLEKFLDAHGLHYSLNEIALEGEHIGRFLMDYAVNAGADLLVMGAYGHSRLQEFVLGGATREVLRETLLPVLLSH